MSLDKERVLACRNAIGEKLGGALRCFFKRRGTIEGDPLKAA